MFFVVMQAAQAASNADPTSVALWVAVISSAATVITGVIATLGAVWSRGARHELRPNSGKSTRDAIDLLNGKLDEHMASSVAHRTEVNDRLSSLETRSAAPVQLVDPIGHVAHLTEPPSSGD